MTNSDIVEMLELAAQNLEESRIKLIHLTERFKTSGSPYDLNSAVLELLFLQGRCRLDWLIQKLVFKCFD